MDLLNDEIVKWFAVRGKDIAKLQDSRRRPAVVSEEQVEMAAVNFYMNISEDDFEKRTLVLKNGRQLKYLDIAWKVWDMAKEINADEYNKKKQRIAKAADHVIHMTEKYGKLEKTFQRVLFHRNILFVILLCWLLKETISVVFFLLGGE